MISFHPKGKHAAQQKLREKKKPCQRAPACQSRSEFGRSFVSEKYRPTTLPLRTTSVTGLFRYRVVGQQVTCNSPSSTGVAHIRHCGGSIERDCRYSRDFSIADIACFGSSCGDGSTSDVRHQQGSDSVLTVTMAVRPEHSIIPARSGTVCGTATLCLSTGRCAASGGIRTRSSARQPRPTIPQAPTRHRITKRKW